MNITVVGAGYVGLTLAAVLADFGHRVWVVRKDSQKNEALKKGKIHFYEPGLRELVKKELKSGRFLPTTEYQEAVPQSEVVFIAVGTPSGPSGEVDLSQVFAAAGQIGKNLKKGYTIVVDKSTVPPGTAQKVLGIIKKNKKQGVKFDVCSCPEFLREGSAVEDTRHPDRIVIGCESPKATHILKQLHKDFQTPILVTKIASAELIKYAANSYLALRIVFANQIADLCEKTGADIQEVIKGIGLDKRIGLHYWYPGLGYSGSCFPKDVVAVASFAKKEGEKNSLFEKMDELNRERISKILTKIQKKFGSFSGKIIGILGLACKRGTDDVRESSAIKIIQILKRKQVSKLVSSEIRTCLRQNLVSSEIKLQVWDPLALKNAQKILTGVVFCKDPYQVAKKADILMILTDWPEFTKLNYAKIKKLMRGNFVFDSRNILPKKKLESLGFIYEGIGR